MIADRFRCRVFVTMRIQLIGVALDARKIVRGEEEEMGVLPCHVTPLNGQVTCTMPKGVWHFSVRRDSLVGELRLRDNTRFRDVRTMRAR